MIVTQIQSDISQKKINNNVLIDNYFDYMTNNRENIDDKNSHSTTALIIAAQRGHVEMC